MNAMRALIVALTSMVLAACGTTTAVSSGGEWLRSQPPIEVTPSIEVGADTAVVAAGLALSNTVTLFHQSLFTPGEAALFYLIYDPLAPNWRIQEQALNADTFYLTMKAKSFRTGGDGEAIQIFKRRALKLQREKGYAGYRILDYSEGVESSTPLTHRVSEGTIQLVRTQIPVRR